MMKPSTSGDDKEQRMAWYHEAKFGLFIHWGAYTVAGVEASWPIMIPALIPAMFKSTVSISEAEYIALAERFNPVDFDPDKWVELAKQAGMQYIVITSKHHDGFCMFDAPGTEYKITNTPFGRDICLELAQACAKAGMRLGYYYSPPDMHHPGYRDTKRPVTKNWTGEPKRKQWRDYLDVMERQLRKLLTDYGEVSIIWFDGLSNHGKYDPERFHKLIHDLSPNTLINDRLGEGYDFVTPEQWIPLEGIPAVTGKPNPGMDPGGDSFFKLVTALSTMPLLSTMIKKQASKIEEGTIKLSKVHQEPYPSPERFQPWETCMTMGTTWAYHPKEEKWKAPDKLVRNLVDVVSHGGNYLLNVGPTETGTFPPEAVERLAYIGEWMRTNHPAIYGTTYTPIQGQAWGQATRKDDKIYLHVYDWPKDGKLLVDPFPGKVFSVNLIEGDALPYTQSGAALEITLPTEPPDRDVSVIVVNIDPSEAALSRYSAPVINKITPQEYINNQATSSFVINAVLNGLIALLSFRLRSFILYDELFFDILITVFIITFLTAWIVVGGARQEYRKGNISKDAALNFGKYLPKNAVLRALLIAILIVVVFGGLFLTGAIYLISPAGLTNWAYIILKTLYTGASGALAAALAILSVASDQNRRSK